MPSDYYEPHPSLRLARPLLLAGQIGCGAAAIGRTLTSRTGLTFFEVDRWIEHDAGCALAEIAAEYGAAHVERQAQEVLERLLKQPRPGVVVFDRAWLPKGAGAALRLQADLVHVKRPAAELLERLPRERHRGGEWLLGGVAWPIQTEADLAPLLEQRRELLDEATIVLDAGTRHENELAAELLGSLSSLTGAQAP